MKYNELKLKPHKKARRHGRGIAAGLGKTAGRGTKGQKSRAGYSKRPGFAGGQNPLMQQLPKLPGFRSLKVKSENVFTDQLDALGSEIDAAALFDKGLISSSFVEVKLLYRGDVSKKHQVSLSGASEKAKNALEAAGGNFKKVDKLKRQASKPKQEKAASETKVKKQK